jgi:hypothetical protein
MDPRSRAATARLAVLCVAQFMLVLDIVVMNVARITLLVSNAAPRRLGTTTVPHTDIEATGELVGVL